LGSDVFIIQALRGGCRKATADSSAALRNDKMHFG